MKSQQRLNRFLALSAAALGTAIFMLSLGRGPAWLAVGIAALAFGCVGSVLLRQ